MKSLSSPQLGTILAALRLFQKLGFADPAQAAFCDPAILDIASDGNSITPLDPEAIDQLCEDLTPPTDLPTFTFWCQEADGSGTIYIGSTDAENLEAAKIAALQICCDDWNAGMISEDPFYNPRTVHLLGIAAGDVEILHWEDIES